MVLPQSLHGIEKPKEESECRSGFTIRTTTDALTNRLRILDRWIRNINEKEIIDDLGAEYPEKLLVPTNSEISQETEQSLWKVQQLFGLFTLLLARCKAKKVYQTLTPAERTICNLLIGEDCGLTYVEIAHLLGTSPSAIKKIINRMKSRGFPLKERAERSGRKRYWIEQRLKPTFLALEGNSKNDRRPEA